MLLRHNISLGGLPTWKTYGFPRLARPLINGRRAYMQKGRFYHVGQSIFNTFLETNRMLARQHAKTVLKTGQHGDTHFCHVAATTPGAGPAKLRHELQKQIQEASRCLQEASRRLQEAPRRLQKVPRRLRDPRGASKNIDFHLVFVDVHILCEMCKSQRIINIFGGPAGVPEASWDLLEASWGLLKAS